MRYTIVLYFVYNIWEQFNENKLLLTFGLLLFVFVTHIVVSRQ